MRFRAAMDALDGFLDDAIKTIQERLPEWADVLGEREHIAETKRREAERLYAEAVAEVEDVPRFRLWLKRTADDTRGMHIMASALLARPKSDQQLMYEAGLSNQQRRQRLSEPEQPSPAPLPGADAAETTRRMASAAGYTTAVDEDGEPFGFVKTTEQYDAEQAEANSHNSGDEDDS